jgi:cell division protein FtsQ
MPRRRVVLLGAVGLGAVAWIGWASPATLVEHVVVKAPRGISAESIRLASGISAADHVPAVDEEKVRLAILTAIPAVADVELSRSLPDTIRLEVTARSPLAAVDAGKGYYVMDAAGVIYDKVGSAKGIPIIRSSTDVGRETARAVLLSLPEDLRRDVRRVTARTRDDVSLTLRGGATVRWGSAEDAALKARVLAGLVQVKADVYDVSAPLLPTTSGHPVDDADD